MLMWNSHEPINMLCKRPINTVCLAVIVNQMNYKTTSEHTILVKQVQYLQNGGKATFSPGYATPKNVILQKGLPILRKSGMLCNQ